MRLEIGNAGVRELSRDRWVHSGPRNTAPLAFYEQQQTSAYPWFFLQFRKTL